MSSWPDLPALELLVALADHGSLSAAARACGVAQPNASRTMARLERTMGLSLVQRATTGATVTTHGLMVVEWARVALDAASAVDAGAAALRAEGAAPLTVMASQTIAEHLLPAWITAWRPPTHTTLPPGQAPDTGRGSSPSTAPSGIRVSVGNTSAVLAAARSGDIDLGFIEGPGAPRGLNSMVVAHDELVAVVAPSHPWAARPNVSREELASTPLVSREAGSGTRVALGRALSGIDLAPPALVLTSNAAVRVSAAAGTAPAVLSRLAVEDALRGGSLVEVPVADLDLTRNLRAVWPGPRRLTHSAAQALLAVAADAAGTAALPA